jgi:hypothetical protein
VTDSAYFSATAWAGIGGLIGVIGTIIVALVNKQPPMAALIDARIRLLIEKYEYRIAELEDRVEDLTQELHLARAKINNG